MAPRYYQFRKGNTVDADGQCASLRATRSDLSAEAPRWASFSGINAYIAGVVEQNIQFALFGGAQG
jgi:hypothetical protein